MPSGSSNINNKSIQEEEMLCTQKGVHHLDIALCGCQNKDKMAAAPTPSAMWLPQAKDGRCSPQCSSCPWARKRKTMDNPQRLDCPHRATLLLRMLDSILHSYGWLWCHRFWLLHPGLLGSLQLGADSAEVYTFGSTITLQRVSINWITSADTVHLDKCDSLIDLLLRWGQLVTQG